MVEKILIALIVILSIFFLHLHYEEQEDIYKILNIFDARIRELEDKISELEKEE